MYWLMEKKSKVATKKSHKCRQKSAEMRNYFPYFDAKTPREALKYISQVTLYIGHNFFWSRTYLDLNALIISREISEDPKTLEDFTRNGILFRKLFGPNVKKMLKWSKNMLKNNLLKQWKVKFGGKSYRNKLEKSIFYIRMTLTYGVIRGNCR